jgi:glycosyltransferase involved in cell wall biosynthesis
MTLPFITACVIVRDEAQNLPKWLDSVKIFADEIIVVDTGSADRIS